ncbi:MAG: hypothetical protein HOP16_12030 [Acidobacteria bacterium]|nr:hypothetical protein [Acidobacteriota bacterium]
MSHFALLVGLLGSALLMACAGTLSGQATRVPEVRQFVVDTLELELKGERWRELTDQTSSRDYYSRVAWPTESEPGWDTFFVNDSYRIVRVTPVESRLIYEFVNGDVRTAPASGFSVDIEFADSAKFGTDWHIEATSSSLSLFVIERDGKLLIADRLAAPRFSATTALKVLETQQFRAEALNSLRAELRRKLTGQQGQRR